MRQVEASAALGPVSIAMSGGRLISRDNGGAPRGIVLESTSAERPVSFSLTSGTITANNLRVNANATFTMTGGSIAGLTWDGLRVGNGGTFNLVSGTLSPGNTSKLNVLAGGRFTQEAGSLVNFHSGITVGGTYAMNGGSLTMQIGGLGLAAGGLWQGYGTITNNNWGFTYNGRFVADGDGQDRNLNFSLFGGRWDTSATDFLVENTVINPVNGTNGWYAVDRGRLMFPRVGGSISGLSSNKDNFVRGENGSNYNIGETTSASVLKDRLREDTVIDLVNSVRLEFTGLGSTDGTLDGRLYAVDRSDFVAAPVGHTFLSVHELLLNNNTFTNVAVSIRYDHTALLALDGIEESTAFLRLMQLVDGSWADVTGTLETENRILTSTATDSLGFFAVTVVAVPEPATVMMLLVGGGLAVGRGLKRRRSERRAWRRRHP